MKKFLISLFATLHARLFFYMFRTGMVACDTDPTVPELVQKSLDKITDRVKEIGEKAIAEAKAAGAVSTETKAKVDEMLVEFGGLQQKLKDVQQEVVAVRDGAKGNDAPVSAGQAVTDSDAFKQFVKDGFRGRVSIPVKSVNVKAVTSASNSAGQGRDVDFRGEIISLGRRKFTIRDLMVPGRTSQASVTYVRESGFTNNAAVVTEAVKKPESTLTLEAVNQAVTTIAHFMKASNQIVADIPMLQSYIEGRLRYGLAFAEEVQLLKGSGVGINLNGIYTQATAYAQPAGVVVTAETIIDRFRLMMLQVFLAEYPATGIVMNPTDWASIELAKDGQNRYLIGAATEVLGPRLWGLPVVETQAMTVNTGLVGAFRPFAELYDREDVNIVIATENEDDFVKNLITIRAEERLAMAVTRPEAFVKAADVTP